MKVQVEIHSNLDFQKVTEKKLKQIIFKDVLRNIGRQALQDVKNTFKTNTDITGTPFQDLKPKYQKYKFKNKDKILTLMGHLSKSIRMKTNESNMTVSVGSTLDEAYPLMHLMGEGDNPQRKWLYTEQERHSMFTSDKMLLDITLESLNAFRKSFEMLLKTKMRKIGSTTLDL